MSRYYYDFHIHSCLSPCGDEDNTPNNIAGMAALIGLNMVALTDHNSCKNCPAFFEAAKRNGIIPIAGMELTTSEDIHIVCLFEELEKAMLFDKEIEKRRIRIKNRPDIFGHQFILDGEDNIIGEEEDLLINATTLSVDDVYMLVKDFEGICYPAHIDRQSGGIIAILGTLPEKPDFKCIELNQKEKLKEYTEKYNLSNKLRLISSDAHRLEDISEKEAYLEIEDEPYSSALVRKNLFKMLRGETL